MDPMGYSCDINGVFIGYQWQMNGTSMGCFHGISWDDYGIFSLQWSEISIGNPRSIEVSFAGQIIETRSGLLYIPLPCLITRG